MFLGCSWGASANAQRDGVAPLFDITPQRTSNEECNRHCTVHYINALRKTSRGHSTTNLYVHA
eukprot:9479971-Pyramimonas_sp.AAC.1